jgi:sec-independent protein translocase protein TatC
LEASVTSGAVFWVSVLFLTGTAFWYFILAPISLNFLANYVIDPTIENQFDLLSYISMITTLVLACGLMFQLPMVIYVLAKFSIIKASGLKALRRHSIVVILLISAIITPTSDPFTLMLVALPLYILYETGILLASRVEVRQAKGQA